ncbi:hypothetical protein LYSIN_01008 [Lysinibacillus sphaericus]|uniref:DUF3908 domain-containing protein n=1 Tax=Lysinibacillus sphaericus TaxID=1421 RepID=A0A2S5CZI8_LYSSH|nr:DUF3908 family protein [Lysinibacillus sphaericus]POZ56225.1 hypothetical protein LYSIN_01008 [Lysinibacillus sphaericus]
MEYSNFKQSVYDGVLDNRGTLNRIIKYVDELLKEDIIAFYAKNLLNQNQTELFYFSSKGIYRVLVNGDSFICHFNNSEIVTKQIQIPQYSNEEHYLKVTFANGESIELNNVEDSNEDWQNEYSRFLKELYLVI